MNLRDATSKVGQILDEERVAPTLQYDMAERAPVINAAAAYLHPLSRDIHPRTVQEHPEKFFLKSANLDLLRALSDQVSEQDRPALLAASLSRISRGDSYRHTPGEELKAGQWRRCSSELPLVAEFVVRRGDKQLFIGALSKAILSPGLTLLLVQLEEMIALNFTMFTDEEYTQLRAATDTIRGAVPEFERRPRPHDTIARNTVYHVCREVPVLCDCVSEVCRKAAFLHLKGSLLPGMNLEINQDKNSVCTFLEKLGFARLLIQSLDEAEKLYRTAATPFDLKSSLAARGNSKSRRKRTISRPIRGYPNPQPGRRNAL